jgi:very-short-patch-repair endonuclease
MDKRTPAARRLRRDATDVERKLWQHLRRFPIDGAHFRRQAPLGPYFADFACHAMRVVIELDGGHDGGGIQAERDRHREAYLRNQGYRVLRFWNSDVVNNIEGVLSVIVDAVTGAETPPTPDPSPPLRGGRGTARRV